jgi:hypothetical protein
MFDEQMFDELFIIYLQNNIDLFTNLRPGRIARDVRQYVQKGSDYSLPFSFLVFAILHKFDRWHIVLWKTDNHNRTCKNCIVP